MMIYIGNKAAVILKKNLLENANIKAKGYFKENNYWVAFDNCSGDCFVEEFPIEKEAIAWVNNCFEVSDDERINVIKIFPMVYYIYKKGFLKTHVQNDIMQSRFIPFPFI